MVTKEKKRTKALARAWADWQQSDVKRYDTFRNWTKRNYPVSDPNASLDCELYKSKPCFCHLCMIESCPNCNQHSQPSIDQYIGPPDDFWRPGPPVECKTYDATEYSQKQLERLAKGLPLQMMSKSVQRRLEVQKGK